MNFYLLRKQTTNNKQTIIKWIGGEKELKYHQQQQFEITHRERMRKRATEGGGEREGERGRERERKREDKKVARERERERDISPFSIIASFLNIFLGFGEQSSS